MAAYGENLMATHTREISGSVAGDRRRPAASIKTVESEDMTSSLLWIGVPADPRRNRRNPRPMRSQRPAAPVVSLLRRAELSKEQPARAISTRARRPFVRETSSLDCEGCGSSWVGGRRA